MRGYPPVTIFVDVTWGALEHVETRKTIDFATDENMRLFAVQTAVAVDLLCMRPASYAEFIVGTLYTSTRTMDNCSRP